MLRFVAASCLHRRHWRTPTVRDEQWLATSPPRQFLRLAPARRVRGAKDAGAGGGPTRGRRVASAMDCVRAEPRPLGVVRARVARWRRSPAARARGVRRGTSRADVEQLQRASAPSSARRSTSAHASAPRASQMPGSRVLPREVQLPGRRRAQIFGRVRRSATNRYSTITATRLLPQTKPPPRCLRRARRRGSQRRFPIHAPSGPVVLTLRALVRLLASHRLACPCPRGARRSSRVAVDVSASLSARGAGGGATFRRRAGPCNATQPRNPRTSGSWRGTPTRRDHRGAGHRDNQLLLELWRGQRVHRPGSRAALVARPTPSPTPPPPPTASAVIAVAAADGIPDTEHITRRLFAANPLSRRHWRCADRLQDSARRSRRAVVRAAALRVFALRWAHACWTMWGARTSDGRTYRTPASGG